MYDLIIIGAGPAGLTASIYASCFNLSHLVIGKVLGGQMSLAPDIINYPGFENISGEELTERMVSQVKTRGGEILTEFVSRIDKGIEGFDVIAEDGKKYQAKTLLLSTGTERRKLNVPGEVEYTGKGVEYCLTSGESEYAGKIAAVIGGGNSAAQVAIQLSSAAAGVFIIYRGGELRADPILLDQIKNDPKIKIFYNTQVSEISGDSRKVTGVKLKSNTPNTSQTLSAVEEPNFPYPPGDLPVEKVFVEIGGVPGTALIIPLGVEMTPEGFIKVDEKLSTNIAGVFAAGDIVHTEISTEQISSAVGLGAKAAFSVFSFIKQQKAPTLWGQHQIKRQS